jgi:iron complex transport system substrate-binding protein
VTFTGAGPRGHTRGIPGARPGDAVLGDDTMNGEPMRDVRPATRSRWLGPSFRGPAERVVSLVPSLTHAVFDLGAGSIVVGRTEFCVRPADETERVAVVGGTKNPDVEKILALEPDIVLANREENTRPRVQRLAERVPVLLTDPGSPLDVPVLWLELGAVCGRAQEAERRARELEAEIGHIDAAPRSSSPRFVYWIWRDPWMAAGPDTYVSRLLTMGGWVNALPPRSDRYPRLDPAEAVSWANTTLLFASEPYPFQLPRDLDTFPGTAVEEEGVRWRLESGARALAVDGQMLSWYPSLTLRGLRTAARLREAIEAAE